MIRGCAKRHPTDKTQQIQMDGKWHGFSYSRVERRVQTIKELSCLCVNGAAVTVGNERAVEEVKTFNFIIGCFQ